MTSYLPGLEANIPRCTGQQQIINLSLLEKKLWAFESIGVGEHEQMHFLTDSTL